MFTLHNSVQPNGDGLIISTQQCTTTIFVKGCEICMHTDAELQNALRSQSEDVNHRWMEDDL